MSKDVKYEIEKVLELVERVYPDWKPAFNTVNALNMVHIVYNYGDIGEDFDLDDNISLDDLRRIRKESSLISEFATPLLTATSQMITTLFIRDHKDTMSNVIVNFVPSRAILASLVASEDDDSESLYLNQIINENKVSSIGVKTYSRDNYRTRILMVHDYMKKFIKNPHRSSIPHKDKIKSLVGIFNEIEEHFINSGDNIELLHATGIEDTSDYRDLIILLASLYVDNILEMIVNFDTFKDSVNPLTKDPCSSTISILEVEDPDFKKVCPEEYRLLTKYKDYILKTSINLSGIMEHVFASIVHLYILDVLYNTITHKNDDDEITTNLINNYFDIAKVLRVQMGMHALFKEDLLFNIEHHKKNGVFDKINQESNQELDRINDLKRRLESGEIFMASDSDVPPKIYN